MENSMTRYQLMKNRTMAAALIVAGGMALGVATHAQTGGSKADPVKVDPKHYRVEFENESVRVLRISYAPGEKSVMHHHPNAVAVYLTDGATKMTMPDGKAQELPAKAGGTAWTPAGNHLPQNVGPKPLQVILVEMKK